MVKIKWRGVQAFRNEFDAGRIEQDTRIYIPNPRRHEDDLSYIVMDRNTLLKENGLEFDKRIPREQEKSSSFNPNQILSRRGWYVLG
ncbi:MAG: hypothetical protein AABW67_06355 [Nanoarchaeota archaeon]